MAAGGVGRMQFQLTWQKGGGVHPERQNVGRRPDVGNGPELEAIGLHPADPFRLRQLRREPVDEGDQRLFGARKIQPQRQQTDSPVDHVRGGRLLHLIDLRGIEPPVLHLEAVCPVERSPVRSAADAMPGAAVQKPTPLKRPDVRCMRLFIPQRLVPGDMQKSDGAKLLSQPRRDIGQRDGVLPANRLGAEKTNGNQKSEERSAVVAHDLSLEV